MFTLRPYAGRPSPDVLGSRKWGEDVLGSRKSGEDVVAVLRGMLLPIQ